MNDTHLFCIDSTPTIYRYSHLGVYENHANLKGFQSYPHRYGSAVTISNDASIALVCDGSNERVLLLSLNPIKLISTFSVTKKPDLCLFSDNRNYFVIGSNSGRLSVYETFSCERVAELQLPDEIVTVAFSKEGSKLAISTMDKKIHLLYIATQKIAHVFNIDDIVEALTFSDDNNKIIAFSRFGNTHILNIMMKQQFLGEPLLEWPTHIASGFNPHVLLVGSRSNQLGIYSNSDGSKLGVVSLDYWGVTSISASAEKIFIGFSDGNGVIIDLREMIEDAMKALENNDIGRLCLIVLESPLVFVQPQLCAEIEQHYQEIFAYYPSSADEKKGYEAITALIVSDGTIRKELLQKLYLSEEIAPFMDQISQGNTQDACSAAYDAPLLRQLREFHEVRSSCLKELMTEIKLLENDPDKFKEHVQSIPAGCSQCVHSIIPSPETLEENYKKLASSAIANNFSAIMEITEKYTVLRQTKVYRRIMNYGEALIDKTLMMIAAGKISEADTYASKLSRIKPFANTGNDFKNQIKAFENFVAASKANNLQKIFTMASEFPALRTTEAFKTHIDEYKKKIYIPSMNYANSGDVAKVIATIAPYAAIDYFEEKNFYLIKSALIHEIKLYAPIGEEQPLLYRYHECFGWDEEYAQVCDEFKVIPNELRKLDEIPPECKSLTTLLTGEKKLRTSTTDEDDNA
jgi:WD40 repeat protein